MIATFAGRFHPRERSRQRLLPFLARIERINRLFRGLIVAVTALALGGIWLAWPDGRAAAAGLAQRAKWGVQRSLGFEPSRPEVDAYWRDRRDRRAERTRRQYESQFAALAPERQAFFRAGGMGPEEAVVRWGNYDMTLVMSGEVFAPDEHGREYRLRPGVRSIWLRQFGVLKMNVLIFQLPDKPEVRRTAAAAGAEIIAGPSQTTNSWGCRGPEPDLNAPIRGIVLGDSYMQGFLVGDDQTPSEQLRKHLQAELGARVSILNTGTAGYCPEHYYYTLKEFADRFRPRFVVVGLYSNDFGEDVDVVSGQGDWAEEKHWLHLILAHCRSRGIRCLFAPVPCEGQITGVRTEGNYPGQVSNLVSVAGRWFCDPTDAFIDEDLTFRLPGKSGVKTLNGRSHLYNARLGDGHLSPAGTAVWGKFVAHRLALLIRNEPEYGEVAEGTGEAVAGGHQTSSDWWR